MKTLQFFFLALLVGLFMGCEPDPCKDVECGPGDCVEGICDCPDGFAGISCEIELCFGLVCSNGDCDSQTEECNCYPNYYGDGCDILCVNGEFTDGNCNCLEGYEGVACDTEIRHCFLGYWDVDVWTIASQIGGTPSPGFLPGVIRLIESDNILEVELYTPPNHSGMMLVDTDHRIVGRVNGNTLNFEFQPLIPEVLHSTVYGSASLDDAGVLSLELYPFNPITSLTEEAKGTFTRHHGK